MPVGIGTVHDRDNGREAPYVPLGRMRRFAEIYKGRAYGPCFSVLRLRAAGRGLAGQARFVLPDDASEMRWGSGTFVPEQRKGPLVAAPQFWLTARPGPFAGDDERGGLLLRAQDFHKTDRIGAAITPRLIRAQDCDCQQDCHPRQFRRDDPKGHLAQPLQLAHLSQSPLL